MAMSRWRGAARVPSGPPIEIEPELTSSRPAIIRRSVDFPHPDGPTSTMNSPSPTVSETSSIARKPFAKSFVTCSSRISPTTSSFHGAGGQPERDLALHEAEEDEHGDRGQPLAGHQPAPVHLPTRAVAVRDPERERL